MKLTWEETREVAMYLHDKVQDHFHDALVVCLRDKYGDCEIEDNDVNKIRQELKNIL